MGALFVLHASMGFHRCVHFTVSYGIFPLPQKPLVLHRAPLSPHPKPKATADFLTVSLVLPFPERLMVAVVQCVDFRLALSLGNMHLCFLHVFLSLNSTPLSGWTPVYLSSHLFNCISFASRTHEVFFESFISLTQ